MSKRKQNLLLRAWLLDTTQRQAAAFAKVNRNTATLFFRHIRELIFEHLRHAPRFSGEVEIDQAYFGNNKKVGGKHKKAWVKGADGNMYEIYRHPEKMKENRVLVLGILQRGGDVYTHIIKRADRRTLFPIIHMVLERGKSIIYTDKWRSYDELGIKGYKHEAINKAQGYVGPRKGVHINQIENFWGYAKDRLTKFHGISRRTYPLHIKECEFRYNHKHDLEKALKKLIATTGE